MGFLHSRPAFGRGGTAGLVVVLATVLAVPLTVTSCGEEDLPLAHPVEFDAPLPVRFAPITDPYFEAKNPLFSEPRLEVRAMAVSAEAVVIGGATARLESCCNAMIWQSRDGLTWSPSGGPGTRRATGVDDIAASSTTFIALGTRIIDTFMDIDYVGTVWRSADGRRWTRIGGKAFDDDHPGAIAIGHTGFVAVGARHTWTSYDGVHWEKATPRLGGERFFTDVAASRGNYVAVVYAMVDPGVDGVGATSALEFWLSDDGRHWERTRGLPAQPDDSWGELHGISGFTGFGDGYVAVGAVASRPTAWVSLEGRSWQAVTVDEAVPGYVQSVAASTHGLVAVGEVADRPTAWVSPDGRSWSRIPIELAEGHEPALVTFRDIVASDHGFLVAGEVLTPELVDQDIAVWRGVS